MNIEGHSDYSCFAFLPIVGIYWASLCCYTITIGWLFWYVEIEIDR